MSHALAGGFLTTAPPGKSHRGIFKLLEGNGDGCPLDTMRTSSSRKFHVSTLDCDTFDKVYLCEMVAEIRSMKINVEQEMRVGGVRGFRGCACFPNVPERERKVFCFCFLIQLLFPIVTKFLG